MNGLFAPVGGLQRVAQLMAGVMHEHIVERRALHGKRIHGRIGISRSFHQRDRGARAVVRGDPENIFIRFDLRHFGQRFQRLHPILRNAGKADFQDIFARDGGFQFQRRIERDEFSVIHDGDAVAELVGFVHVVRGHEDRQIAFVF